jgi:hypothetical protein
MYINTLIKCFVCFSLFFSSVFVKNNNDVFFSHGTRCAGAAAGEANNEVCGVGAAFGAFITG